MAVRKPALLHQKSHGLVDPEDDRPIELAIYDILLPCRNFLIDHKVAVLGRTSLTTEFLLRLVKAVPGISEEDAAAFFGFNVRETSFVLAEAEAPGYIERRDGRLWLSLAGDALFRDGSSEPEIFAVEPRRREVGFDLISLAPQRPRFLSEFERWRSSTRKPPGPRRPEFRRPSESSSSRSPIVGSAARARRRIFTRSIRSHQRIAF